MHERHNLGSLSDSIRGCDVAIAGGVEHMGHHPMGATRQTNPVSSRTSWWIQRHEHG